MIVRYNEPSRKLVLVLGLHMSHMEYTREALFSLHTSEFHGDSHEEIDEY